ncbi:MAG: hypothetical protein HZA12_07015, partial [Nitrospirae bacterium]|nr:hypothetical protein [Nitrospirota bacterium]
APKANLSAYTGVTKVIAPMMRALHKERLLQKYKNVVIPAGFKREYSVLLQKIIFVPEIFYRG